MKESQDWDPLAFLKIREQNSNVIIKIEIDRGSWGGGGIESRN